MLLSKSQVRAIQFLKCDSGMWQYLFLLCPTQINVMISDFV